MKQILTTGGEHISHNNIRNTLKKLGYMLSLASVLSSCNKGDLIPTTGTVKTSLDPAKNIVLTVQVDIPEEDGNPLTKENILLPKDGSPITGQASITMNGNTIQQTSIQSTLQVGGTFTQSTNIAGGRTNQGTRTPNTINDVDGTAIIELTDGTTVTIGLRYKK